MRVRCWLHTTYVSDGGNGWEPGEGVSHELTEAEAERLLELFSYEDWEDGPRCLLDVLAKDQREELQPRLLVRRRRRPFDSQ
jgi:hypothetical protein